MRRFIILTAAWLILGSTASLFAQGIQTGTIRGTVKDQQDLAVPGVTVTATSPALQGARGAVTDARGNFTIRALPPGEYQVRFELSGFGTVTRAATVPLGLVVETNVAMPAAGVSESVQVTGELPAPVTTPVVGQNLVREEVEVLATPRTIQGIAQLSPSVNENSPNAGQVIVNGAFGYDNVFMVNGVDINDNLFATPQNLFIEDAIQETQVLTSGISAEYGRFTGGVINAITKSGGNTFTGSGRINFLNPSWTTETPFEKCTDKSLVVCTSSTSHLDVLSRTYEGTFGGPIVRDHLWFFASGRYGSVNSSTTLAETGTVLPTNDTNKRGELKITATVAKDHTIQGGFLNDPRKRTNNSGIQSLLIDQHSEVDRSNPNWYAYGNYHGVLKNNMLVEAQFSERRFQFLNDGGTSTALSDSPFIGSCQCTFYNAPYFDATDPESRNNKQFTGNLTNYWNAGGKHETKVGYEFFRSQRKGGNSQSSTSYVFAVDYLTTATGSPALDANGRLIPTFNPGDVLQYFPAVRGATMNTDNQSVFVQDHWTINSRFSADLGARFEKVNAVSTGDIKSIDVSRIVPRISTAYDLTGDGNQILHVTYGQYAGRYNEALIGANSPVGNPAEIDYVYTGPAGQGIGFAPGLNLNNYTVTSASDPLQNIIIAPGTKSPLVHEFTTGYAAGLFNNRGHAEVTYIFRKTTSMIEDYLDKTTGRTNVVVNGISAGLFTNKVFQNTDLAKREYQAMVFQSQYRIKNSWSVNGHYTLELKNNGNYEGEGTNQPGKVSPIGDYPEAFPEDRFYPDGRLQNFERNRLRIWSVYNQDLKRAGNVSVSGLWRLEGERVYSLSIRNVPTSSQQAAILAAAGYPDTPSTNNIFFGGERGTERFPGYGLFDLDVNYDIPVFRSLKPWLKFDVYNLFDNQKLIAWNTTLSQSGAKDAYGYSNSYTRGSSFGKATGNTQTNLNYTGIYSFPRAFDGAPAGGRTLRVALGFRF
jgi:hypothetical protein